MTVDGGIQTPSRREKALALIQIDPDQMIPHYQQLEERLLEAIGSGGLVRGDPLPSEREFAESLGISRMTVRRALKDLESRGWLVSQVGKGWFVSPSKIEQRLSHLSGFSSDMELLDLRVTSRVLTFSKIGITGQLAHSLKVPVGTEGYLLERIRFVNEEPLGVESAKLRCDLCPGLLRFDFSTDSLYRVLREEYGLELANAEQTVEASLADWRESSLLQVEEGSPVLRGTRVLYDPLGSVIESSSAVYRGDRYKYRVRMSGDIHAKGFFH
jgi:GntR family transcriptional regulator